jgi:hypothetical protein
MYIYIHIYYTSPNVIDIDPSTKPNCIINTPLVQRTQPTSPETSPRARNPQTGPKSQPVWMETARNTFYSMAPTSLDLFESFRLLSLCFRALLSSCFNLCRALHLRGWTSLERAVSQASCCHPLTCGPSTWAPLTSGSAPARSLPQTSPRYPTSPSAKTVLCSASGR